MEPFVELGCRIAFGGAATFGRNDDIRAAAAACPEHLLLSETDSPYMAPMPLRGQECEPAMVAFSVARIAQVRADSGVASADKTYAALWHNANRFFGLS
jgi:TatD DNase family protein